MFCSDMKRPSSTSSSRDPLSGRAAGSNRRLRLASSFKAVFLAALTLITLVPWQATPAVGSDLRLVFGNDFTASNRVEDDLYTGALALEIDRGAYRFSFGENVFTDRDNDLRFDETYLSVERELPSLGVWRSQVQVGVVHVGEGLLGQSAQNALHGLIGSEEVDLPYVESSRFHPTLRLRFHRPLPILRQLSFTTYGELYSAIDFKHHVSSGVHLRWPALSFATLEFGAGARYTATDFAPLDPHVGGLAATWEVGVIVFENIFLNWKYNEFGTEAQHFTLGYDLNWKNKKVARSVS